MELNQTQERKVYNVTADQNGWKINATVTVVEGKVVNLDGAAFKEENLSVAFNGYRSGETLYRSVHNVTDATYGVYDVIEEFVASVEDKYNY